MGGQLVAKEVAVKTKIKTAIGDSSPYLCVLYADETRKAIENFVVTGSGFSSQLAKNIAAVKIAAAKTNQQLGNLDSDIAEAIVKAGEELIRGLYDDQLVVDAIQGGAGTSMNMNVNEVLASRATQLLQGVKTVHYLDDVNMAQSTNDVVPTAMKITTLQLLDELIISLKELYRSTIKKSEDFSDVMKVGRTHLQDAVPIYLGQEFAAHASMIKRCIRRLENTKENLTCLNLGGTAVGTCINSTKDYINGVNLELSEITGYKLKSAEDLIDATQYPDVFYEVSSALSILAANLIKMCNDLRLMASGPYAGYGEIVFEERQKGSTIMPGKINPVMAEMLNQVCYQVIGNNQTIMLATQAGQFELNTMLPVVAKNLFESLGILKNGVDKFSFYGMKLIRANRNHCRLTFEKSYAIITYLAPKIGYDKASEMVKTMKKEYKSLKEVLIEKGVLTEDEYLEISDSSFLTSPAD